MMNRSMPNSGLPPSLLHEHMGREYVASRVLGNLCWLELLRHEGREVYIPQVVAKEIAENLMQPRRLSRLSVQHG